MTMSCITLVLVAYLTTSLGRCDAIACYNCSGLITSACGEPFDPAGIHTCDVGSSCGVATATVEGGYSNGLYPTLVAVTCQKGRSQKGRSQNGRESINNKKLSIPTNSIIGRLTTVLWAVFLGWYPWSVRVIYCHKSVSNQFHSKTLLIIKLYGTAYSLV